ncbi:unnamed protein product [Moneuplotes crassus]|uniref:Uncharacterized protein n=1 Tax=Euplotes crassus TaxID=5936 RepID=A0AAD1UJQ3_EUPCR|nr:unnamed protein product [Moneuplotes crassus]
MQQVSVIPARFSSTESRLSGSDGRFDYKSVLNKAFKAKIDSHWVKNLGVLEKKGIKVLDAIISTKGCRKYEKRSKANVNKGTGFGDSGSQSSLLNDLSAKKAYERMQNMRNRSSYADTFGKDAEADHESSILTFKRFKDLPYTSVLRSCEGSVPRYERKSFSQVSSPIKKFTDPQANSALEMFKNGSNAKEYIERWLINAKDTYYKDLLMRILKAVYVHVHCKQPCQSLYKNSFHTINKEEVQSPPRIDKLNLRKFEEPTVEQRFLKFPELKKATMNLNLQGYKQKFDLIRQEVKILSGDIKKRTIRKNSFNKIKDVSNVPIDLQISKIQKKKLLEGSGNINAIYDSFEPKASYYQQCYKGAISKYVNPRMDKEPHPSTMLSVSPDPTTLIKAKKIRPNLA